MKNTTNAFLGGLRTDLHPMATDNQTLTDALNATLVTYNGNEMMLQNDMGNTKIQDSKTGNIMGLSEGFVPVGMKEHGGIMYIASVNKDGRGEIGTIPSPIYTIQEENIPDGLTQQLANNEGPVTNQVILNNTKLHPGDKFVVQLPLNVEPISGPIYYVSTLFGQPKELIAPIVPISHFNLKEGGLVKGLYDIRLYTVYGTGVRELTHAMEKPQIYYTDSLDPKSSEYWFLDTQTPIQLNTEYMYISNVFKTYPGNVPPGRLAVKSKLEGISDFKLIRVQQSGEAKQRFTRAPYVKRVKDGSSISYELCFLGFEYKLNSCRYIGQIEINLYNESESSTRLDCGGVYSLTPTDEQQAFRLLAESELGPGTKHLQIRKSTSKTWYQIQEDSVVPNRPATNDFLFTCNIGNKLKNWYKLEVKYKDMYGGLIDTFVHVFNPYHILNYTDSYTPQWRSDNLYTQYFDINKEDQLLSFETELPLPTSVIDATSTVSLTIPERTWETSISQQIQDGFFEYENKEYQIAAVPRDWYINNSSQNTGNSYTIKEDYTMSYLYKDHPVSAAFTIPELKVSNNCYFPQDREVVTGMDFKVGNYSVLGSSSVQRNFDQGRKGQWGFDKEEITVHQSYTIPEHKCNITLQSTTDVSTNVPLQAIITKTPLFFVSDLPTGVEKSNESMWAGNIPDFQICFTDDKASSNTLTINAESQPNKSAYSVMSSFSLYGDTEDKKNVRLGLNRQGELTKAWVFDKNYANVSKEPNSSIQSTFQKNPGYIKETGSIQDQILPAGVYIINIQALPQQANAEFIIGSNLGKVETKNLEGEYHFVPTLFYLPTDQIISFSWKNIKFFANVGIYKVNQEVKYSDDTMFGQGDSFKSIYYQHDDLKENNYPILPLSATYYELARCFDRQYDYYQGTQDASCVDRHFIGDSKVEYIYTYFKDDPVNTIIPCVDGQGFSKLQYRTLNK